jgi:hypothetical protein
VTSRLAAAGPKQGRDALSAEGLVYLFHQVVLDSHLLDLVQLRLDPVDVVLFIGEDRFEKLSGPVVAELYGLADVRVVLLDGVVLGLPALTSYWRS